MKRRISGIRPIPLKKREYFTDAPRTQQTEPTRTKDQIGHVAALTAILRTNQSERKIKKQKQAFFSCFKVLQEIKGQKD